MTALAFLSLCEARDAIATGELCPVEYLDALLLQIESLNADCGAFLGVETERARAVALQRRKSWRSHKLPPLFGIPFAVKDNIDVEGSVTTCQSRAGFIQPASRTAPCIEALIEAGGIYLGKTALNEFALGDQVVEQPWLATRNPWNTRYTPGSSSSGSGAALAARMVPLAIGTDTGGSIRSPAMMNGVVGLKPTHGRVSAAGLFPLAPSMDTVGPMARTVADVEVAFRCMVGEAGKEPPRKLDSPPRLGRVDHLWCVDLQPSVDVEQAVDRAFSDLASAGATVEERMLPSMQAFNAVGWTTLHAEAFAIHRPGLRSSPELFGASTREMLLTGAFISAADFVSAQDMRLDLSHAIDRALQDVNGLVTATSALPPCVLDDDEAITALGQASTRVLCNVTGHPALALPIGLSKQGLPIGIQVIGRKHCELELLAVGSWIESQLSGWMPRKIPPRLAQEMRE